MAKIQTAIDLLKARLTELEEASISKKSEIETTYKEAIAAANKTHKEAIATADKTKKEALAQFNQDDKEKESIGVALKALGERVPFPIKASKVATEKAPANFTVPRTYDEAKSDNQKVYFAVKELGSGTNVEILKKVNSFGAAFDTKQISNAVNNLKNKFQVITEDGKIGKALKYKVA
jgi:hypothetical protein